MTNDEMPDVIWAGAADAGDTIDDTWFKTKPNVDHLQHFIKYHRAQEPIEGTGNSATAPLIHRTEDKDGNKVVVVAEWFYDELNKESEPIEGLREAVKIAEERHKKYGEGGECEPFRSAFRTVLQAAKREMERQG